MKNIHHEFNSIPLKQDFAIDEVISGLEKRVEFTLDMAKKRLERIEKDIEAGKHLEGYDAGFGFKDVVNANNALVLARVLKESGVETLRLDPAKSLTEQVLAEKDKATLSDYQKTYKFKYQP